MGKENSMNLNNCVLSFINTLSELMLRPLGRIDGVEFCATDGYKKDNTPPLDGWKPYDLSVPLTGIGTDITLRNLHACRE